MKLTTNQLIHARIEARDISEKLVAAYWVDEDRRPYHIKDAMRSFAALAETLGYDIKKREVTEELSPDFVILV